MNRRGFLGSILAAATAPAIVRADALMRIVPRELEVATYGNRLLTIDQITREALRVLHESGKFTRGVNSQYDPSAFSRRLIEPTMRRLSERIDRDILAIAKSEQVPWR